VSLNLPDNYQERKSRARVGTGFPIQQISHLDERKVDFELPDSHSEQRHFKRIGTPFPYQPGEIIGNEEEG